MQISNRVTPTKVGATLFTRPIKPTSAMTQQPGQFVGVFPVLQTPYHADWSIDWEAFAHQVQWVIQHGAAGLVLAMVSEVPRLTDAERGELAQKTVIAANGRVPVIVSVGDESTVQALGHLRQAVASGASAVMATPPTFTACDVDGLLDYYHALLDATDLPVIVQDSSGYLGRPVPFAVQVALFEQHGARVMFKPEAPPIGQHISRLLQHTNGQATVFDGLGGVMLIDHYQRGVRGVMPAADLIWATTALWDALVSGNEAYAQAIHAPLAAMVSQMCNLDAFLVIIKTLLVEQGVFTSNRVRGPVGYRLDPPTEQRVMQLLDQLRRATCMTDIPASCR